MFAGGPLLAPPRLATPVSPWHSRHTEAANRETNLAMVQPVDPSWQQQKRFQQARCAWLLVASVAVWLALAAPFLSGRIYTSDDLWAFHLPVRAFYAQALASGEAFDWMPSLYAGFYVTGEGQLGAYHPWHWLLYRFLPLDTAFGLELLLPYPMLLAGMFLFLRRCRLPRDAALFGGLVFTYGSFNTLHFVHPNAIAVVAHLPWLLWAIDVLCARHRWAATRAGRPRAALCPGPRLWATAATVLVLFTASQLLLGYPQYVWFSLLAEVGFFVYRTSAWTARARCKVAAEGTLWLLLGVGVGAIQLLPTFDALAESSRIVAGSDFYSGGQLHPLNLLQLGSPYVFKQRVAGDNTHELGFYLGAVPLLLLAWAACHASRLAPRRRLAGASTLFAGLAFILAMGHSAGLYTVQSWLPVVGNFRLPARYLVLVQLGLAVVAACAWAGFFQGRGERGGRTVAPAFDSNTRQLLLRMVLGFAAISLAAGWIWTTWAAPLPLRLAGPALLAVALALMAAAPRHRWAAIALGLFTAADLCVYGGSYAFWQNTYRWSDAVATLQGPGAEMPRARVATDLPLPDGSPRLPRIGDQLTMNGWHQVDGYAGLEPQRALNYRDLAALRAAGVQWVYATADNVPPELVAQAVDVAGTADPKMVSAAGPRPRWWPLPDPIPRASLIPAVVPSRSPATDIGRINLADTALLDPRTTDPTVFELLGTRRPPEASAVPGDAFLRYENRSAHGAPGGAACRVVMDRPGRIKVEASTSSPQLLLVTERFHRGWRAVVDGQAAPVLKANGEFLACLVMPGEHRIEFVFAPNSLHWGRRITLLALTLAFLLIVGRSCWICYREWKRS